MADMAIADPAAIPEGYEGNAPEIDKQFAVVAVEAAETYWSLLENVPASRLKLSKHDDQLVETLKADFPEFFENDFAKLRVVDEEAMKSKTGKAKWRKWLKQWENTMNEYNFGTILRTDCSDEFTEGNAMFCLRAQAYAIEIARLRNGLNDWIYPAAQAKKAAEAKAS